jgi:transposase
MFGLGSATKVFVATGAVDMWKGFEGLYGLVRDELGRDPRSGHLFLFANRSRTRWKTLFWDGCWLWVWAKRLEKGHVQWPERGDGEASVGMRQEELALLVAGVVADRAGELRFLEEYAL